MTDRQKHLLGWVLVAVAIVAAGFLGVKYPIPEPPEGLGDVGAQSVRYGQYGSIQVPSGSVKIGTDAPSVSQDTDDLYVQDQFEVDGEAQFDGAVDANSTSDFVDTATFSKGSGNAVSVSSGGASNLLGYVNVGDGTPDGAVTSGTDEQFYCEGAAEFDAEAEFDGTIDADGAANFAGTVTLESGSKIAGSDTTTGTHGVVMEVDGSFTHAISETETSIASIPANANIVDMMLVVETSWNDGASATVNIGPEGSLTDYVDSYDLNGASANTVVRLDGSNIKVGALGDVGASVVDVHVKIAEGTGDASAGAATLYIWYQIDG